MNHPIFKTPRSALFLILSLAMLPACGGSTPPPAPPPPPPAPVAAAPAAPAPAPAPEATPKAATAEEAPPAPPKHHRHDMAGLLVSSLDSVDLKPEQKSAVDGIKSDLEKLGDASKEPRSKLEADVADGVNAGKLDHAKTDADIKALGTAVAATTPSWQDAMNRLHKTLDTDQRKKLVEAMREKGKEMHEHGMGEHGMGEHGEAKGEHGMGEHGEAKGARGEAKGEHEHGMGEHGEAKGKAHEHDGPGGGMAEGPLMKLGSELQLTPEQKEKIRAKLEPQMKAQHAAMKDKMAAAEKHMAQVGEAFESDKFDAKKSGVGVQAPEMVKAVATERVQFVETVLPVLTPEQRSKFATHLKEHAEDAD
jgi:Spy/CpxP family protein refolding chaperone